MHDGGMSESFFKMARMFLMLLLAEVVIGSIVLEHDPTALTGVLVLTGSAAVVTAVCAILGVKHRRRERAEWESMSPEDRIIQKAIRAQMRRR